MIRDIDDSGNMANEIAGALFLERCPDLTGDVHNAVENFHVNVTIAQEVVELEAINQPRLQTRVKRVHEALVSDDGLTSSGGLIRGACLRTPDRGHG
jgi:hypothetical protein